MERLFLPTFLVDCDETSDGEEEFVEGAPGGEPAGVAVALAHQEAVEAREVAEEVSNRREFSFAQGAEHLQPDRGNHARGREVGMCRGHRLQLQQSHGQHAGEARDRFEAMSLHEWA